jgi:hypothetical protein
MNANSTARFVTSTTQTVRFSAWNAQGKLQHRERTFATQAAMERFLNRLDAAGDLHEVLAFSN